MSAHDTQCWHRGVAGVLLQLIRTPALKETRVVSSSCPFTARENVIAIV